MTVSAADRASFRQAIGPSLAKLVHEIASDSDLGERELGAGSSLPGILRELPDELVGEAMDIVAEADGGPAVLASMSVAARTELAVAARVRLEEIEADAPTARLTVVEGWELVAEGEPVTALTVLCEREGEPGAQAFSFVLEGPVSGGAIKDGFVTGLGMGRQIVEKLEANALAGTELLPIDPAEAHVRVVAAAAQGARGGWAPAEDGMDAVRIFLRAAEDPDADAIIQALELGDSLEARTAVLQDMRIARELEELLGAAEPWLRSEGLADERIEAAIDALEMMGEFQVAHGVPSLGAWSADELDEFMLEWVPRNVELAAETFPAAIGDALRFLASTESIEVDAATALARHAERNAGAFAEAMADPERHGPTGAIVAAMRADGVEIGDEAAMQDWIEAFNASTWAERDAVLGPAIDRSISPPRQPSKKRAPRKAQKQARRRNRRRS